MLEPISVHPDFRFNGIAYTAAELSEVAYSLIKEGEPYEISIGDFMLDWVSPSEWVTVKTSGSTGPPKTIRLRKQQMVNSARATGQFLDLRSGQKALLCLPSEYIAGKMMLVRAMTLGLELDSIAPSSAPLHSGTKAYDFAAMVPLQLANSLAHIDKLKQVIVGGAPFPENLKEQMRGKTISVYETFGMTETVSHIALKKINAHPSEELPVFKTLPGVRISTDDRDCLVVEAPEIISKKIVTNDMVKLVTDDAFQWLGRYDNLINSGGVKIIPERLEEKFRDSLTSRFFVAGKEDSLLGQRLVLILEGQADTEEVFMRIGKVRTLSKYEIPKAIYTVPEFVETPTGKIDRAGTLALLQEQPRTRSD